ncbi:pyridoxamine 5'-phosphate oxidase family protein [Streptosporangium lutulentum]|uniref:Nitroimidazol reductase NimA-like FMN-containing flavoprotein (Pyridoxamine 5'-phosphate oxidase superfamily) n=1 Tax=Streptosporangium lutulentum TaxID=1461250 RepID=A0ABT9Q4J5_9ACTN|nr:pyridoxamine 5'-phosphate oxidase family protein [Streptosporangium lutulentum]MDP9840879.1 nitroimidazol reductase NimA-like FMN-containing flavoprotein (pyridoxamine 5'-phosphate oxidase superfamily) [Streptosporangium lutulentum]
MSELSATERTRHRRLREKGRTDRAALYEVLRAGFVCHLGVISEGVPMVVPTVYGFDAGHLYVHGSSASRSLTGRESSGARAGSGSPDGDADARPGPSAGPSVVCVTVTHVDGLVLARSVFEHGVNYRSAMVYGVPRRLEGEEKLAALRILTEHSAPGQWDYARRPSRKELAATTILAISLAEASVKVSSGPPDDGEGPDAALGLWAGVLPLATTWLAPIPDPLLPEGATPPDHIGGRTGTRLS